MTLVKFFGNLRQIAGKSTLSVDGNTVEEIFAVLRLLNGPLVETIMDQASLRPYYKIMLNGQDISLLGGLTTPTQPEDIIAIFPPIAGGSYSCVHKGKAQWH